MKSSAVGKIFRVFLTSQLLWSAVLVSGVAAAEPESDQVALQKLCEKADALTTKTSDRLQSLYRQMEDIKATDGWKLAANEAAKAFQNAYVDSRVLASMAVELTGGRVFSSPQIVQLKSDKAAALAADIETRTFLLHSVGGNRAAELDSFEALDQEIADLQLQLRILETLKAVRDHDEVHMRREKMDSAP